MADIESVDDLRGMLGTEVAAAFKALQAERDNAVRFAVSLEHDFAALLTAAENMALVLGPAVDFIQIFESSENAQNLALLMAMQLAAYRALVPASAQGEG